MSQNAWGLAPPGCLTPLLPVHAAAAEELKRKREEEERKRYKEERRKAKLAEAAARLGGTSAAPTKPAVPATPIAFLFPGQGSQAVVMLKVCRGARGCCG
jgi:hypothetical protein